MSNKNKVVEKKTISTKIAAQMIMVTPAWLGKLEKEGFVKKVSRGQWDLVNVVQGYIRWLKDDDRRSSKSAAQSRLHDIKAAREELSYRKEQRDLVAANEINEVLDFISAKVRAEFAGMPASFTRDPELRKRLETDTNARLSRLADAFEKAADFVEKGGELFKAG